MRLHKVLWLRRMKFTFKCKTKFSISSWSRLIWPSLSSFKHSTSLEKNCHQESTHPLCPALTHSGSVGALSKLWELQFGGPALALPSVCGCPFTGKQWVDRTPGVEGGLGAESPPSLPLGHRHCAIVTDSAPNQTCVPNFSFTSPSASDWNFPLGAETTS